VTKIVMAGFAALALAVGPLAPPAHAAVGPASMCRRCRSAKGRSRASNVTHT